MKTTSILICMVLIVSTASLAAAEMEILPSTCPMAGWRWQGERQTLHPGDLFDFMDGGAELFLEFGIARLWLQKLGRGQAELTIELYAMADPAAALGIFLSQSGTEQKDPKLTQRHTVGRYQLKLVKNRYYLVIGNRTGDPNLVADMVTLAQALAARISEVNGPDWSLLLQSKNQVAGSFRLARGPIALESFCTLGTGDILKLHGQATAAWARYQEAKDRETRRLAVVYPNNRFAKDAFGNLASHLDSNLRLTSRSETMLTFNDGAQLTAEVNLSASRLDVLVFLSTDKAEAGTAANRVWISRGPTPIREGEAIANNDITLGNDRLAVSIAVGSAAPWGIPPGGILDACIIKDGQPGPDRLILVDFLPHGWNVSMLSDSTVEVLKDDPDEGVIQVQRRWENLQVKTQVRLRRGENMIRMSTTLTNAGHAPYQDILSGNIFYPKKGAMFGIPGQCGQQEGTMADTFSDWAAAYDQGWVMALHAPFADLFDYQGRDLFARHTLLPGQSRTFEGIFQFVPDGDLAPVLALEVQNKSITTGTIEGRVVMNSGEPVDEPFLLIKKDGRLAYFVKAERGRYQLTLPPGNYTLIATGKDLTPSTPLSLSLAAGQTRKQDFTDLQAPAELSIEVVDQQGPIDARITLQDEEPGIQFLSRQTYFTELEPKGRARFLLPSGKHVLAVNSGAPFFSREQKLELTLAPKEKKSLHVVVPTEAFPERQGWACADLHHHSDLLDGKTPPEILVRSELAARLSLINAGDHDTNHNLRQVADLAQKRNIPFIPAVEFSPAFGHFNAFPFSMEPELPTPPLAPTVSEVFASARAHGASIIVANHPLQANGYFKSQQEGKLPGGYNPAFDLVELNFKGRYLETVPAVWKLWNQGLRYYLSAGTDTHDAWSQLSGQIRICAQVGAPLTADNFILAIKLGHAYVTLGPLIHSETMFGESTTNSRQPGQPLSFALTAVEGLGLAALVCDGAKVEEKKLSGERSANVVFRVPSKNPSWCSIMAEDRKGHQAWSNPIWVRTSPQQK